MGIGVAVGYMRVSGDGQISGGGFPRQEAAIKAYCATAGLELEDLYAEEGISGKLSEEFRPAFQEMVAALLTNGCRTIVVESLDRLARQYDVQQQLATYLASKGLALISANTGENITEALNGDPMRRAMIQIQGIFAELDKNLLTAKLKKGLERKRALTGKAQGRLCYGLKPGEAETLQQMRDLRASGATFESIAGTLNRSGSVTRYGKRWHPSSINKMLAR